MSVADAAEDNGAIAGRAQFQAAVRAALREAARDGCRELWLADADFAAWPLGERGVVEDLARWVDSRRRLHLLAADYDAVARLHPRWVAWRRDWAHVVACRSNPEIERAALPTLLLAPGLLSLRLVDPAGFRGRVSRDASDAVRAREHLDAALERSVVAFAVTPTGL